MTYREFTIPKKNGKVRKICAPDKELLKEQRKLLPYLLETFLAAEYKNFGTERIFHGFIKHRNYVTAAIQHIGYDHTIMLDISNFFDSVQYSYLKEYNLNLDKTIVTHKQGYTPQGFATSPLLANLYLIKPIKDIKTMVPLLFNKDIKITVYADDIQISLNNTTYETMNSIIDFISNTFNQYNLTINKRKTRIRHAKYGNRRILGVMVGKDKIYPNRRLKKKIRAARFQRNGPSLGGLVTAAKLMKPKLY